MHRAQMKGKPVVAIYRSDDRSGVFVRVCMSDVGFLHKLRDELLTGTFAHELTIALKGKNKAEHKDLDDQLTISVDKTQFAERYEASVLNLNKLKQITWCSELQQLDISRYVAIISIY